MAEKCINKSLEALTEFDKTCCGCPPEITSYYPSSDPYISYEVGPEDMLSFSTTQWVIPIKFHCGCNVIYNPGGGPTKTQYYSQIHSVKVVGTNTANVSFVYLNNATFSNAYPSNFGGNTYSQTLNGWAMVVDKDPTNVLQAKSSGLSGVNIEVQKCSDSTPFSFSLYTEYFFADNFRRYSNTTGCSNTGGATDQIYLWQGAQNTGGQTFLNGSTGTGYVGCYKDLTTYFATPVVFSDSCLVSQGGSNIRWQALKTIQSITVVNSNEPLNWGSHAPNSVWATYNGSQGLWYINVDKNPGGTYHDKTAANPNTDSTVDLEIVVLEANTPCKVDPNDAFDNSIKTSTITVTDVALSNFNNITFCTF